MNSICTFLGFAPALTDQIISYKDKFDAVYIDHGQMILVSKDTYSAEADGELPAFEYKYILNCFDFQAFGADRNEIVVQCRLCPLQKYINKEKLSELLESVNGEVYDEDFYFEDMSSTGILSCLGTEYIRYDPEKVLEDEHGNRWYDYYYNLTDNKDFVLMLNVAATVLNCIDAMRGEFIDNVWNQIGNTGWDNLNYLLNGKDWLNAAIRRFKENDNENEGENK